MHMFNIVFLDEIKVLYFCHNLIIIIIKASLMIEKLGCKLVNCLNNPYCSIYPLMSIPISFRLTTKTRKSLWSNWEKINYQINYFIGALILIKRKTR